MGNDLTLDEVLAEMVRVRGELAELPRSAYERRNTLHARLAELRGLAADAQEPSATDVEALRSRLRRLESELERRLGSPVSQSAAAQTGRGGGIDPRFVHQLNRAIDKGTGVAELKAEIRNIRALLDR
jgi:hypothetical protein